MAVANMHKIAEDRKRSFGDMLADRQRHTDRQTRSSYFPCSPHRVKTCSRIKVQAQIISLVA